MSFDFNVLSSDDDGSDKEESGNVFGENKNETIGGDTTQSTRMTKMISTEDKTMDFDLSDVDSLHSNKHNDFAFDGYDDYYDFEDEDRKPSSMESSSETLAFPSDFDVTTTPSVLGQNENDDPSDNDDHEDEDEIDWEDAEEDPREPAATATSMTPKAITIDLDKDKNTNESNDARSKQPKRTKRARSVSVFRHDKLEGNPGLQSLLGDLHKASLLAWASHAYGISQHASDETHLGLAHSLISTAWLWKGEEDCSVAIPTHKDVGHFVHWFRTYVVGSSNSSSHAAPRESRNTASTTSPRTYTRTGNRVRSNSGKPTNPGNGRRKSSKAAAAPKKWASLASFKSIKTTTDRFEKYCLYLSNIHRPNNPPAREDQVFFRDDETLLLFLSMVRSMGWRARYLVALEPISRDLDVNHPLFYNDAGIEKKSSSSLSSWLSSSFGNSNSSVLAKFFGKVLLWGHGKKETPISIDDEEVEDSKPPAKKTLTTNASQKLPESLFRNNSDVHGNTTGSNYQHVCWAEVLCKSKSTSTSPQGRQSRAAAKSKTPPTAMQWMHVDPILGKVNQPNSVEEAIFNRDKERNNTTDGNGKNKSKHIRTNGRRNKLPISYALAVEHLHPHSGALETSTPIVVRMTDVTRRYATSMVATMEARGIVQQKVSSKPKRRKTKRARMTGTSCLMEKTRDRPDEWFSEFLDAMNKRYAPTRNRNKGQPAQQELRSKGNSKDDAIALDCDESGAREQKPDAMNGTGTNTSQNANSMDIELEEESQLKESAKREPLPTSKAAFKKHPMYVIRSVLNSTEVLRPEAKSRVCGMFKGELVFRRQDVETALSAKRWLYEGRKVKDAELKHPILKTKARKAPGGKGFKALKSYGMGVSNDGSEASRQQQIEEASEPLNHGLELLYGSWQTNKWGPPPVGPGDPIPINEHNNIELELLNPGLVHVELYRVAKVAKKLGLPYAPCLLGFENGSGKPTIRGIVVHETNEVLLREAHAAMHDHLMQEENEKREKAILLRWKRLLVGVLTKDRLEREYGRDDGGDGSGSSCEK